MMFNSIINEKKIDFTYNDINIASVVLDEFNSKIFGMKMGNVIINDESSYTERLIEFITKQTTKEGFDHLSIKISTGAKKYIFKLQENGYFLVDTLVSYIFDFNKNVIPEMIHRCTLRGPKQDDLKDVKIFTREAFVIDRFHSDPYLDKNKADNYYETWIENSYKGYADDIVVAEDAGVPLGYTTLKYPISSESKTAHMILSAVSKKSRGKGVYTSTIHEGLVRLSKVADKVIVGTQIDNYAVQKTWNKLGFEIFESKCVFHIKTRK